MDKENDPEITKTIKKMISVPGNHACRNDPNNICHVIPPSSEDLLFVSNKKYLSCPYYTPFGYEGFCTLPARKEIFKEYNI